MRKTKEEKETEKKLKQAFRQALDMELKEHKSSFLVFCVLRILVIVSMVRQFFLGNYQGFFLCLLTMALLYLPSWFQVQLKVEAPPGLEITILCFIFAAEILGELNEFYVHIPFWDTMLHTLNGFLCAAIGFSAVMVLHKNEKIVFELSPGFLAMVAFCFSMTVGLIWEFFEFGMDWFMGLDMQKDAIVSSISSIMLDSSGGQTPVTLRDIQNVILVYGDGTQEALNLGGYLDIGLIDTMKDLLVNFVGALFFSIIGYFYAKRKENEGIVSLFVPRKKTKEQDYMRIAQNTLEKEEKTKKEKKTRKEKEDGASP
ncbi:MAG: hypothetical protein LUF78_03245 [Clostridiales bacterium]|nr:hypothetical protein [Clostridiales bacterium]